MNEWGKLAAACVLISVFCAALVWWLERFETERLAAQFQAYLGKVDRFRDWESRQGHDGVG